MDISQLAFSSDIQRTSNFYLMNFFQSLVMCFWSIGHRTLPSISTTENKHKCWCYELLVLFSWKLRTKLTDVYALALLLLLLSEIAYEVC